MLPVEATKENVVSSGDVLGLQGVVAWPLPLAQVFRDSQDVPDALLQGCHPSSVFVRLGAPESGSSLTKPGKGSLQPRLETSDVLRPSLGSQEVAFFAVIQSERHRIARSGRPTPLLR